MNKRTINFAFRLAKAIDLVVKFKNTRPSGWLFRFYYKAQIGILVASDPALFLLVKKITKKL